VTQGEADKAQADADTLAREEAEAAAAAEAARIEAERPTLTVAPDTIPADGVTAAVVTYTDPGTERTTSVAFTANGISESVDLDANGVALLDVVSSTPGDTITVSVDTIPNTVTVTVN
jgi:hypothetical protein